MTSAWRLLLIKEAASVIASGRRIEVQLRERLLCQIRMVNRSRSACVTRMCKSPNCSLKNCTTASCHWAWQSSGRHQVVDAGVAERLPYLVLLLDELHQAAAVALELVAEVVPPLPNQPVPLLTRDLLN